MITSDILSLSRERLQDTKAPFLWESWELLLYLNQAYNEWVKESGCILDDSTPAIIQIPILCNQPTYALHPQITEVRYGRLFTAKKDVKVKSDIWLSQFILDWKYATGTVEYMVPDYDSGKIRVVRFPDPSLGYFSKAFVFTASDNSISQTGAKFSGTLSAGDEVVISGTTSNGTDIIPATFTVVTATADSFTVLEDITDETASAGVIRKVIDTLYLTVTRLGAALTATGMDTQSPEMRTEDHIKLVDGIMREAYLKKDADTLDPKASMEHGEIFEHNKLKARAAKDNLRWSEVVARPDFGSL
jgi:hypothetical protein